MCTISPNEEESVHQFMFITHHTCSLLGEIQNFVNKSNVKITVNYKLVRPGALSSPTYHAGNILVNQ